MAEQRAALSAFVGASPGVQSIKQLVATIAHSHVPVMINGESGTGKEVVARALHECSDRADGPFVPVNCGAIPAELVESELFGHRKGAFTGALGDRRGRFELAHGGTLFLDEIGEMPLPMQVKLLRVLQEGTVDPLGASSSVAVDVRVVSATHRDLTKAIEDGDFREDLYYRLNVLPVEIPPLRQRLEDLPALLDHFARLSAPPQGTPVKFSDQLVDVFQSYDWPGNVRELSNLVSRCTAVMPGKRIQPETIPLSLWPHGIRQRLVEAGMGCEFGAGLMAAGGPAESAGLCDETPAEVVDCADVAEVDRCGGHARNDIEEAIMLGQGWTSVPDEGIDLRQVLASIEADLIKQALDKNDGNVSQASRQLKTRRTTLIEKINKYQLGCAG